MRNCLILGTGRSGTSMVAGTLASAGYFMGDDLLPATESNPKGFFESREVEALNEELIRTMLRPTRAEKVMRWLGMLSPQPNFGDAESWARVLWLAILPPHRAPIVTPAKTERIARITSNRPFCLKDPRFCYTLPAWRAQAPDTVYICVFRDPARTATSILKEVEREDYLKGVHLSRLQALDVWACMYRHILEKHRHQGEWLFLHYDQVFTPEGLDRIEAFTGARVDRSFPETGLARTTPDVFGAPRSFLRIYEQLCDLAEYSE